jgi:hypothetical protein
MPDIRGWKELRVAATGLRKVGAVLIMPSVDSRPPHTSLLGNSPGRMSRVKMREDSVDSIVWEGFHGNWWVKRCVLWGLQYTIIHCDVVEVELWCHHDVISMISYCGAIIQCSRMTLKKLAQWLLVLFNS